MISSGFVGCGTLNFIAEDTGVATRFRISFEHRSTDRLSLILTLGGANAVIS